MIYIYIEANEILENEEVLLYNNVIGKVIRKELENLTYEETTYNFEVEDNHNYYVGEECVLVHNDCGVDSNNKEFNMANRGHSKNSRIEPKNLNEYYAMQEIISNPLDGTILTKVQMTDLRWPSSEGWVKMQRTYKFFGDKKCTIHYVLNKSLKLIDDFKFVFPK